jgi:hypothetical protein
VVSLSRTSAPAPSHRSPNGFEEERDRHAQHLAQLIEAAGAYAVFSLLVLVQLLIRDAQDCGKFWLAHSQSHPPLSHTRSDMNIDRMRRILLPTTAKHQSFSFAPRLGSLLIEIASGFSVFSPASISRN